MSRSSRRVSRPLIAVLAVVMVLGLFFGLHKLHKAHAEVARPGPIPIVIEPAPVAPATPLAVTPPAKTLAPAMKVETPAAAAPDPSALVTQTPTEKVATDAAPAPAAPATGVEPAAPAKAEVASGISPPPAPATAVESAIPADQAESDGKGLAQWAEKIKPAGRPAASASSDASAGSANEATPPVHAVLSAQPMVDAKSRMDSGDLVAARDILNEALIAGRGSDAASLKKQIEQINETLMFSPRKFPADPWGGSYQVMGGERLGTIAARNNVSWEYLARVNSVTPKKLRQGQTIKIAKGPFYAVVYKSQFMMEIYLGAPGGAGSMFVRSFPVGLGKDNSTPTGLWMCKAGDKIRNPRYYPTQGGEVIDAGDPKNPLGGYWIAIEGLDGQAVGKESYGIHGTIDPNSIGKMESQGCIRLRDADISWVFDLLVDGKSKVLVKD